MALLRRLHWADSTGNTSVPRVGWVVWRPEWIQRESADQPPVRRRTTGWFAGTCWRFLSCWLWQCRRSSLNLPHFGTGRASGTPARDRKHRELGHPGRSSRGSRRGKAGSRPTNTCDFSPPFPPHLPREFRKINSVPATVDRQRTGIGSSRQNGLGQRPCADRLLRSAQNMANSCHPGGWLFSCRCSRLVHPSSGTPNNAAASLRQRCRSSSSG